MEKTRTVQQEYHVCDYCRKEVDLRADDLHMIHGDFPTVIFHMEPCLRQAAVLGARVHNEGNVPINRIHG
jgi:hypothetical protein